MDLVTKLTVGVCWWVLCKILVNYLFLYTKPAFFVVFVLLLFHLKITFQKSTCIPLVFDFKFCFLSDISVIFKERRQVLWQFSLDWKGYFFLSEKETSTENHFTAVTAYIKEKFKRIYLQLGCAGFIGSIHKKWLEIGRFICSHFLKPICSPVIMTFAISSAGLCRPQVSLLAWAHLGQSWAELVSVPVLWPSACCLPCLSSMTVPPWEGSGQLREMLLNKQETLVGLSVRRL